MNNLFLYLLNQFLSLMIFNLHNIFQLSKIQKHSCAETDLEALCEKLKCYRTHLFLHISMTLLVRAMVGTPSIVTITPARRGLQIPKTTCILHTTIMFYIESIICTHFKLVDCDQEKNKQKLKLLRKGYEEVMNVCELLFLTYVD